MQDKNKTKEQLTKELAELRQRIAGLERAETERKRLEVELQESKERYRSLVDNIDLGINLIDPDHNIIMVNCTQARHLNKPLSQSIGKKCFREFEKRDAVCPHCPGVQTMATGQPAEAEVEVTGDGQSRFNVRIQTFPTFGKDGIVTAFIEVVEDITERKQLEALLLRERETFVTILQNALYGVVLLDREGKHVYVNPEFTAITGYTLEDIPTGRDWMQRAYPDEAYRQKIRELWKKDRRVGGTRRVISVVCKDGETKEIEFRPSVLDDRRSVVMLADVTERVRIEEDLQRHREHLEELVTERTAALQAANEQLQREITERTGVEEELQKAYGELQKSEQRYRTLVENINLGINLIDSDHTLLMANAAQSKALKKPVSELIGEKCFREFEKRDAVCPDCPGVQTMATAKPAEVEIEGVRDDGNRFHARLQTFPVFGQDGTVTGFIEVVEDITERKQMEEELRESEDRFKMLAEDAPFGISVMAPDRSFEYLNPRFTEIFGYTLEDIPDKDTWFEKAYPDKAYRKKVISAWKRDITEEVKIGDENLRVFTVRCKDGQDKIIDFRNVDLIGGKQYLVYEDITVRAKAEESLRESEERYRTLVENMSHRINLIDSDHNIVMVNAAQSKALKKPVSELIGKKCFREFVQRDAVCPDCPGVQTMATGKPAEVEVEGEGALDNGSQYHARVQAFPVFGQAGTVTGFIEVAEDITERKQMEEELRESQKELQTLLDASPAAISWADLQGNIQYINRKHHELFGYTLEEIPTIDAWQRQADHDPVQRERFAHWGQELLEAHKHGRSLPLQEMTVTCKDGSVRYVTVEGTVVSNHNLVIYNDITERVRAEEAIRKLAYHDALTGLPNRVLFADRLNFAMSQAYRSQRRLAVMLLDLDRFKNVNDTFGHSVGDALLHSVGKRLTGLLRKNDTISRTGGDEFSLLMPEIDQEKDTVTVAQKVLDVFQEPFVLDVHELHITTSIGIAIYPDDGEDADTLLKHSDIAMYQAKQKGRNNYQRYTPI